jgi:hypothetical protein
MPDNRDYPKAYGSRCNRGRGVICTRPKPHRQVNQHKLRAAREAAERRDARAFIACCAALSLTASAIAYMLAGLWTR